MTDYTVSFRAPHHTATAIIEAETPEHALAEAQIIAAEHDTCHNTLDWDAHDVDPQIEEIEVCDEEDKEVAGWIDPGVLLRNHAEAMKQIIERFVDTAHDSLPDGIEDPAYAPAAALLADAKAVLAQATPCAD